VHWSDDVVDAVTVIRPSNAPEGVVAAFSGRGHAPEGEATPTPFLARRFSRALGLDGMPIQWARQVHGNDVVALREPIERGVARDAGHCDALVTPLTGTAVVVQSADCIPILLAAPEAVGAAHSGWRGTAKNTAGAAVAALARLGAAPSTLRAWIGPAIGACCYEVGGDVAAQFAGELVRRGCGGGFLLDLKAANVAQLEAAGIPRASIAVHPACTKCGGEKFASYRRDGARAGRMIALVARL
jgi:polyphenol oxidase